MKTKLIPILILSILLTACMQGLTPAPSAYPPPEAYPASATQTNLPLMQTNAPTITMTSPVKSNVTVYPTPRRDLTPTPNLTSIAWPEFSSEFTYQEDGVPFVGTVHYAFRYPSDWYLYPGVINIAPGLEGSTYLQNYERLNNHPDYPSQTVGTIKLSIYALPCSSTEQGCPVDLPVLAADYPGTQEMIYHSGWTTWTTFLFVNGFRFMLQAYMPGTPEENTELLQTMEDILATVRLW